MGLRDIILSPITAIYAFTVKAQRGLKIEEEIKTVLSLLLIYVFIGAFSDFRISMAMSFGSLTYLICVAIYLGIDLKSHATTVVKSGKEEIKSKLNKPKYTNSKGEEIFDEEEISEEDEILEEEENERKILGANEEVIIEEEIIEEEEITEEDSISQDKQTVLEPNTFFPIDDSIPPPPNLVTVDDSLLAGLMPDINPTKGD